MKRPPVLDPYTGRPVTDAQTPETLVTGPMPDDGYQATRPVPVGAAHKATFLVVDDDGQAIAMHVREKQDTDGPDIRQADQRKMYARLKRGEPPTGDAA